LNIKPRVGSERSTGRRFDIQPRKTAMTKLALLGAAALLSATPVTAQEVIYNPGYCAQFYPNANCPNKGPNNPYTDDSQRRTQIRDSFAWSAGPRASGAEFYRSRDGRRHYCY
jgi:hypothetical protein